MNLSRGNHSHINKNNNNNNNHIQHSQIPKYHDSINYFTDKDRYITPTLLSMESINTAYSSYIQPNMGEIPITFIEPRKHDANAMADTGANINAISMAIAEKLYSKYIKTERRSFRVRTGGGYISCQEYLTFAIRSDHTNLYNLKFYIIPDLPFDYIIGRPLLHQLGYKLTKINPKMTTEYHHDRDNVDYLPDEDVINHPSPC